MAIEFTPRHQINCHTDEEYAAYKEYLDAIGLTLTASSSIVTRVDHAHEKRITLTYPKWSWDIADIPPVA